MGYWMTLGALFASMALLTLVCWANKETPEEEQRRREMYPIPDVCDEEVEGETAQVA